MSWWWYCDNDSGDNKDDYNTQWCECVEHVNDPLLKHFDETFKSTAKNGHVLCNDKVMMIYSDGHDDEIGNNRNSNTYVGHDYDDCDGDDDDN